MKKPAKSLIDTRRSAVEAWSLLGVLHKGKGDIELLRASLGCYERALGWADVATSGDGKTGEGILEMEWKGLVGELQSRPRGSPCRRPRIAN
jgi:hypothetical protein